MALTMDSTPPDQTETLDDGNTSSPETTDQPSGQRQKRKKARRACLACQRAHLTCSDERPCHRCIKRGLEADCHDGMRKKAKYLHDAPNEALMPGVVDNYIATGDKTDSPTKRQSVVASNEPQVERSQQPQREQAVSFNNFPQSEDAPPQLQLHNTAPFTVFGAQNSPMSAQLNSQQTSPMQTMSASMQPPLDSQTFPTPYMDDPTLFNFDLAGMNFGNHYGALEFGMLGHMSSGAKENLMHRNSATNFDSPPINYALENSPDASKYIYNRNSSVTDWPTNSGIPSEQWNRGSFDQTLPGLLDEPSAYSIGAVPPSATGTSPASNGPEFFDRQHLSADGYPTAQLSQMHSKKKSKMRANPSSVPPPPRGEDGPNELISKKLEKLAPAPVTRKRPRDPSKIYSTVLKPYPYTLGFHALTAVLQRRFPSQKRLRIAQALASIRPSFISCTRTLIDDDLIFMEKSFQRQLWEYEDFVGACGTPTIVCRRTGEVAYAGKEFTTLTGLRKSVLLGSEPNLNVNRRGENEAGSGTMTGSSRGGVNTPRIATEGMRLAAERPQPVFLAELLDDDNVVQFYEDFAKLAFADSKGSACKPCKLLKYRTKDDPSFGTDQSNGQKGEGDKTSNGAVRGSKKRKTQTSSSAVRFDSNGKGNSQSLLRDETGINRLGDKDGKVDCMYCWTVKRDVFDIPMMIVINFLPILS